MISVIIKFILLAMFNISFYSITKASCTLSMWISYGFIHFAFLMFFLEPLFVQNSKNSKHVAIESITLLTIIYFFCSLSVGIFFLINPLLVVYQYSIEVFVTGIYLIILIITVVINNKIAKNESEFLADKQFLTTVFVKAEFIKSKVTDKKLLMDLQEQTKYSPVKSSEIVRNYENELIKILDDTTLNIDVLQEIELNNKIETCKNLLNQRNLLLKKNL